MGSSGAAGSCPGAPQPALWVGHCSLVGQLELLLRCAIPRRPYFPPEPGQSPCQSQLSTVLPRNAWEFGLVIEQSRIQGVQGPRGWNGRLVGESDVVGVCLTLDVAYMWWVLSLQVWCMLGSPNMSYVVGGVVAGVVGVCIPPCGVHGRGGGGGGPHGLLVHPHPQLGAYSN
eukprot:1190207-Prorocentrum_minimum.AAC.1